MENTQKKVYAKYTFASISLAITLIVAVKLILSFADLNFLDLSSFGLLVGICVAYVILSVIGIILVIVAYKHIYVSRRQGIPVKGVFLVSVSAIIFALIFGLFSFSTYEIIRMEINPCYKPGPFIECMPPAPELPRNK